MVGLGLVLLLGGSVSLIYGIIQNNSASAQWNSFLSSGSANPGTVFIVIGAIAAVLGLALIIIGSMSNTQKQTNSPGTMNSNQYTNSDSSMNGWVCPNCSQLNSSYFNVCSCGTPRPQTRPQIRKEDSAPQEKWVCRNCSAINPTSVKVCQCGAPRFQSSAQQAGQPIQQQTVRNASNTEWLCPNCGKINAHYVGTCGCGQVKP